ncbi:MAG: HRDC domain-containing protein [Gammaproteobacteria bacterium]|nr:HRDC domain-containing protein [Gammaproteobacteria bacterium]
MAIPLLIENTDTLEDFAARALAAPWLGLDTEFVRDRTYFPRAGLIQIATPDEIALVDPVTLSQLLPLAPLLFDSAMPKVLHAATQDMELFFCLFERLPTPVFDTQVAAAQLAFTPQISHAALVGEMLQADTPPALGRYNWLRRPLQAQAIEYAAGDVAHLGALYQRLSAQLEQQDKTAAFDQAMRSVVNPERYRPQPERAWKRIRARRRLDDKALARLKALARWREEQAIRQDLPRQWILRDNLLAVLARQAPRNAAELADIHVLKATSRRRYGRDLLRLIADANY